MATLLIPRRQAQAHIRRSAARLAFAALAAAALACSGGGLFGPPAPTLPAPQQWRQPVSSSLITVPMVVDEMLIYQGQSSDVAQDVFGRDTATGELRWTFDLSSYFTQDDWLATDGGLVFVQHSLAVGESRGTGFLLALDARSGNQRWALNLGETWNDSLAVIYPAAFDGRLFFENGYGQAQHTLSAVEAATGDRLWDYPLAGSLTVRPVAVDGLLITAESFYADDVLVSQVFALDPATGAARWAFDLPGNALLSRFVAGEGRVFYVTFDGTAVALEAATGHQLWAMPLPGTQPNDPHREPAYADGQLFVGSGEGVVYALDAATGAENWAYDVNEAFSANLAAGSGLVVVGTLEGRLLALDAATGALQWEVRHELRKAWPDMEYYPPVENAPLLHAGVAYFILNEEMVAMQVGP